MMLFLQLLLLAIIQGLTEMFPVSSTAHIIILGTLLGVKVPLYFATLLHLGTFFCILWFYRSDVLAIIRPRPDWRTLLSFGGSFMATGVVGLPIWHIVEEHFIGNLLSIAALLALNGVIVMVVSTRLRPGQRRLPDLTMREYVIIGAVQGLAAIPGISRLGLTLGLGLYRGLRWHEAVKLSFLLSLPAILGANLYVFLRTHWELFLSPQRMLVTVLQAQRLTDIMLIGLAFAIGFVALRFMTRRFFYGRQFIRFFGVYCLATGIFLSFYLRLYGM